MAYYSIDTDVLIDIFQSGARGIEIGYDSIYTSTPHPGSNKTIQGWQWDKRLWPDKKELEALEYAPSIWDPTSYFLTSGYWQSGIGYNKDLQLFSINDEQIDSQEYWIPKLNHGYFYNRQYESYLFGDDYITELFYNNQLHSGFQYADLSYNPKVGIPIRVARYRRDEVNNQYEVDIDFRKRVKFTGITVSGEESETQNDDGYISFENIEGFEPEFIVDYDYGDKPRVYLNDDYSESIASSGEFSQYELLGIGDGYKNEFYTRYSPIDPSGSFELISYIGSGDYTTLNQINSLSDFQELDVNEYKLDSILGVVTLYSGYPPSAGEKIAARYTKGISVEYEPEKSRDYILADHTNVSPIYSALPKGFLTVGFEDQVPASVVLESDLPTGSNYQSSLAGRNSRLTATVRGSNGEVLPNQEVKFELIVPYISSLISDTAITDHNGEADVVFLPPQNIEDMGVYTTEFRHSGSDTIIDVNGLPVPNTESGVLLYEVHREDTVLGFPASGEDNQINDFLNGAGVYADPDGTPATSTYESLYREQFNLVDINSIDDTDSDTLSIGKKEIVYHNNPNHIHPHSGVQQDPVYSPIFPIRYSNTGTISAPDIELVYDTLLPDFNDEIKSYFAITETTDQVIAYAIDQYTGRRVYSNAISIDITIDDESDGIINCADSDDVPSGLFRETRNLNNYSDDWITDNTYLDLYDKYMDTRLASGEFGYKPLSVEDNTVVLYHLNEELSDAGQYQFTGSGENIDYAEKAGYSNSALHILDSGSNTYVIDSNVLNYFPFNSGTMEFAYRSDDGYVIQSGAYQYLNSFLLTNTERQYNGFESFFYESSGTSYLGLDYYVNNQSLFDSDPIATSIPILEANLTDNKWHQVKATWKCKTHESLAGSGLLDFSCYIDNVLKINRENVLIEQPDINYFNSIFWNKSDTIFERNNNAFQKVTYGNGLFVAVGSSGDIQTSSDGVNWIARDGAGSGFYYGAGYGNGLFVILGQSGRIETSTDGITWTQRTPDDSYIGVFRDVVYDSNNELFVIVGEDGEIQTSPDGITWTVRTSLTSNDFYCVTYGNSLFVAMGSNGLIRTSPDGITWTLRTPDVFFTFSDVIYANSLFVATQTNAGRIETSPDGITWTNRIPDAGFSGAYQSVTYGNSLFLICGSSGEIQVSPDGITWTARTAADGYTGTFGGATYGIGLFVITGITGGGIQTSPDTINWTTREYLNIGSGIGKGTYGNNIYVSVGGTTGLDGKIHISPDGLNWTGIYQIFDEVLTDVTYSDLFVAVGFNGEIQTSLDGITWTQRTPGSGFSDNFHSIINDDNLFVAVGEDGEIQTSLDGITWTHRTPGSGYSGDFECVTYGNNLFVAVGSSGEIQTSSNGISWTSQTNANNYSRSFQSVAYGNNIFIAVGQENEVQISSDGIIWTGIPFFDGYVRNFTDIAYGNEIFVASTSAHTSGGIYVSFDGINWESSPIGFGLNYFCANDLFYANGIFVITDSTQFVYSSSRLYTNITGKDINTSALGYFDEFRLTSGENILEYTFQPNYTQSYESYDSWFRRTRILDSKNIGLNTYLFAGDCPSTIPVGHRLKSSDTQVASEIGYRLFYDLNDSLVDSYYTASGLDTYEEYY